MKKLETGPSGADGEPAIVTGSWHREGWSRSASISCLQGDKEMQYDGIGRPQPNSDDILKANPVAQYQVSVWIVARSHTLYQMTIAHCRFSCRLQVISQAAQVPLCGRVVRPSI